MFKSVVPVSICELWYSLFNFDDRGMGPKNIAHGNNSRNACLWKIRRLVEEVLFLGLLGSVPNDAITCGVVGRETKGHVGWLHSVYHAICSLSPMAESPKALKN